ncbi:MAG: thiosulfate oxidation carrier protein SoxY [Ideonella sp.]|nr:MAG: thiosulfate oxidation carrier protein SoxY [Burkholderiaceae bacterium]MBE7425776.1 thiosulfate oxidation carrier protein SoxY [Ideonella sp.]
MITRRTMLSRSAEVAALLAGAGLLPQPAQAEWAKSAFEAKSAGDALKALAGATPTESKDVLLTAPDIAENGAVVPVACACALPGVKRLALLVEKNPNPLAAVFEVSDAIEPNLATRVKMGQSSHVLAVAMLADGKVLFTQKEVKVTLGGCGG